MASPRDDLREQLMAAIEAAPELPKEDRQHLADVFLDGLTAEYEIVPRGTGRRAQQSRQPRHFGPSGGPPWNARWVWIALTVAFFIFVVPALIHHVVNLLVIVFVVFVVLRVTGIGIGRRRSFGR